GVGGVAGVVFNNSSVTGSYFAGVINGIGSIAGGVAGWLNDSGSMVNCYSTGTVNGYNSVGGVVGSVSKSSSVAGSYFTGEVDGYNSVGGVAGEVSTSSVTGCYSTGAVSGVYISGGVTGSVHNNSAVINCYSTGTVSGTYSYFGGVAGVVILSSLTNCYSTGEVIGRSSVGGVVGVVSFSSVFNCYSTGAVSGKSEVGGVVGVIGDGKVYNCATLNAEVKGDSLTGRVAGRIGNSNSIEYPLANNVAYTGIKNKDGIFDWANIGSYDLDGADITIAEILADGTIGGRFTAENGWTIAAGSLPGLLGNAVSMPAHLGGASVKFSKPSLYSKSSARFISASGRTLRLRLSERGNVSVYALNGAKLRTFDLAGGSHSLTVNDLPRGMYVVRAVSGSWKQSVRLTLK
ncbi:MAG: T9SS type A sorting domain-containing protein, partial [Chitinispirillales bacterium]|nr:T9SS type A sorting domain-containing protein [Chitinispirillales bacterium]